MFPKVLHVLTKKTGLLMFVMAAVSLQSCTGKRSASNDPKDRLTEYIAESFRAKETKDRQKMVTFLTGGAKNRLIAWSDEQFREAFILNKRQFVKLAIREEKKVSDIETNVTYELTYLDPLKGAETRVTNKRMAEMIFENGQWFIREVHNIKELIEYKNEMTL